MTGARTPGPAITRTELARQLRAFGVREGGVVMVHTRMSALGWVVGAAETTVLALLDALGPEGTLSAYASWEEHVYRPTDRPAAHRDAYLAEPPAWDVARSEAARENGRLPERIRTWPGARRSDHPEASVVAVGARAAWLCAEQPADDAYGARSPFARLVEAGGQVLMLGAPLSTITLLHHAEAIASAPGKRRLTFEVDGRTFTDIDTEHGAYDYAGLGLGGDEFEVIGRAALEAGAGVRGTVGDATCHLFDARELVRFGVAWLDQRFG